MENNHSNAPHEGLNNQTCKMKQATVLAPSIDLAQEIKKQKPFIIRGYCPDICAFDVEYLKKNYSDRDTKILEEEEHSEKYNQVISHYEEANIGEFIDTLDEEGSDWYLEQGNIDQTFPGLKKKLPLSDLCKFGTARIINCWLGPKATKSTLHYDGDQNFLIQAQGRKRVQLISPIYTKYLYTKSISFYDGFSDVDSYDPDYTKHPDFKNVTIEQDILEPGDILYIPPGWWHNIQSLDISVSYNIWWLYPSEFVGYLLKETWYRLKGLIGLKPPMEKNQSYYYGLLNILLRK